MDITWRSIGFQQKKFNFTIQSAAFGELIFSRNYGSNATFTTNSGEIQFKQNGFWNNSVMLVRNGQSIGEMSYAHWFRVVLRLTDGKIFKLAITPLARKFRWIDTNDTAVVECEGKTYRGSIRYLRPMTDQEYEVLSSAAMVGYLYILYRLNFLILGAIVTAAILIFASTFK